MPPRTMPSARGAALTIFRPSAATNTIPKLAAVAAGRLYVRNSSSESRKHRYSKSSSSEPVAPLTPAERVENDLTLTRQGLTSHWYRSIQQRIGKCIHFGCDASQIALASRILKTLEMEWRQLLAGSQGFLTGARRGLENQQVVWGEQDSMAHVNNVTYARYAESSRVNWFQYYAKHVAPEHREAWAELMTPRSIGVILKDISIAFKFPLTYPDRISVYHKIYHSLDIKSPQLALDADPEYLSSFQLHAVILSHKNKQPAAYVKEEIVVYDYKAKHKAVMPMSMRHALKDIYNQQQQEEAKMQSRMWQILKIVRKLEDATWNRPNAVEDLGSATNP